MIFELMKLLENASSLQIDIVDCEGGSKKVVFSFGKNAEYRFYYRDHETTEFDLNWTVTLETVYINSPLQRDLRVLANIIRMPVLNSIDMEKITRGSSIIIKDMVYTITIVQGSITVVRNKY